LRFLPLVWAGLCRKPLRSILTALSILVAFTLIGLLDGVNAGFDAVVAKAGREFLTTNLRVRGSPPMPIAMREQIRNIRGVVDVVPRAYFAADYRTPYGVVALATEPRAFFAVRPPVAISEDSLLAMERNRSGFLATPALLKQYDWKVGDVVTLPSRESRLDGSGDWQFVIVGTFDSIENPGTALFGIINYSYLDAARAANRGTAELFYVRVADPNRAVSIGTSIDRMFANSSFPTWTRTDKERAEAQTRQMGDIAYFTRAIVAAVVFALLFLTANTMRQSFQERTAEFAVLKALGFSDAKCLGLAFAESAVLFLIAAIVSLGLSASAAPFMREISSSIEVSWHVASSVLALAVVLAIASVALPAWQLYRLPIARSLALR
jgi:putative ABC transport system permease protein